MIQLREISQTRPEEIQRLANNHAIAVNLRDIFPYPYTLEDAVTYLDLVVKGELGHVFGIYKDDTFVGCCSVIPQYDIYRINAESDIGLESPIGEKGTPPKWKSYQSNMLLRNLIYFESTHIYSSIIPPL